MRIVQSEANGWANNKCLGDTDFSMPFCESGDINLYVFGAVEQISFYDCSESPPSLISSYTLSGVISAIDYVIAEDSNGNVYTYIKGVDLGLADYCCFAVHLVIDGEVYYLDYGYTNACAAGCCGGEATVTIEGEKCGNYDYLGRWYGEPQNVLAGNEDLLFSNKMRIWGQLLFLSDNVEYKKFNNCQITEATITDKYELQGTKLYPVKSVYDNFAPQFADYVAAVLQSGNIIFNDTLHLTNISEGLFKKLTGCVCMRRLLGEFETCDKNLPCECPSTNLCCYFVQNIPENVTATVTYTNYLNEVVTITNVTNSLIPPETVPVPLFCYNDPSEMPLVAPTITVGELVLSCGSEIGDDCQPCMAVVSLDCIYNPCDADWHVKIKNVGGMSIATYTQDQAEEPFALSCTSCYVVTEMVYDGVSLEVQGSSPNFYGEYYVGAFHVATLKLDITTNATECCVELPISCCPVFDILEDENWQVGAEVACTGTVKYRELTKTFNVTLDADACFGGVEISSITANIWFESLDTNFTPVYVQDLTPTYNALTGDYDVKILMAYDTATANIVAATANLLDPCNILGTIDGQMLLNDTSGETPNGNNFFYTHIEVSVGLTNGNIYGVKHILENSIFSQSSPYADIHEFITPYVLPCETVCCPTLNIGGSNFSSESTTACVPPTPSVKLWREVTLTYPAGCDSTISLGKQKITYLDNNLNICGWEYSDINLDFTGNVIRPFFKGYSEDANLIIYGYGFEDCIVNNPAPAGLHSGDINVVWMGGFGYSSDGGNTFDPLNYYADVECEVHTSYGVYIFKVRYTLDYTKTQDFVYGTYENPIVNCEIITQPYCIEDTAQPCCAPPTPPPCSIEINSVTIGDCVDGDVDVTIVFTASGTSDMAKIYFDNVYYGIAYFAGGSITFSVAGNGGTSHTLKIVDFFNGDCFDEATNITLPTCGEDDCEIVITDAAAGDCDEDGTVDVTVTWTAVSTGPTVLIQTSQGFSDSVAAGLGTYIITNQNAVGGGNLTITVTSELNGCFDSVVFALPDCTCSCSITYAADITPPTGTTDLTDYIPYVYDGEAEITINTTTCADGLHPFALFRNLVCVWNDGDPLSPPVTAPPVEAANYTVAGTYPSYAVTGLLDDGSTGGTQYYLYFKDEDGCTATAAFDVESCENDGLIAEVALNTITSLCPIVAAGNENVKARYRRVNASTRAFESNIMTFMTLLSGTTGLPLGSFTTVQEIWNGSGKTGTNYGTVVGNSDMSVLTIPNAAGTPMYYWFSTTFTYLGHLITYKAENIGIPYINTNNPSYLNVTVACSDYTAANCLEATICCAAGYGSGGTLNYYVSTNPDCGVNPVTGTWTAGTSEFVCKECIDLAITACTEYAPPTLGSVTFAPTTGQPTYVITGKNVDCPTGGLATPISTNAPGTAFYDNTGLALASVKVTHTTAGGCTMESCYNITGVRNTCATITAGFALYSQTCCYGDVYLRVKLTPDDSCGVVNKYYRIKNIDDANNYEVDYWTGSGWGCYFLFVGGAEVSC